MVARAAAALLFALALPAQPRRIVSTFPSITETLFAIGAGDRVVGVSNFCRYPPVVLTLPKVGSYTKPDAEKIALLRPDLVILRKSAPGLADRLSALGIPHAEVTIGSLADVYSMINKVGEAAGAADRAEKLDAQIRAKLEAIRAGTRDAAKPTVLILVGKTPGTLTNLVAVGPSAYLGELLEIAGGRNVLTDSAIAYPRISLETVVRADPAVIIDLSMMSETAPRDARFVREWLSHRELQAARNRRVFAIPPEPLTTPGPRVVESVELLRSTLHSQDQP
jgi:iron complex transport system substrate-binding protein